MLMRIILHCILQKNAKKEKFHHLISWQNLVKIKINTPKNQTISIPHLLQAQPALVLQ